MATCTSILRNCFSRVTGKELTASDVTDAGVQKIACVALSIFTGAAGTLLLGLVIAETLPVGCLAIGLPLLFTAIGSAIYGAQIKDYDDPKELQQMRDKAWGQDYHTLISEHGTGPSVIKYSAPSAEAFIVRKGILSADALQVKKEMHDEKISYANQLDDLDRKYTCRREKVLARYDAKINEILREANDARALISYGIKPKPGNTALSMELIRWKEENKLDQARRERDRALEGPLCHVEQAAYTEAKSKLSKEHLDRETSLQSRLDALHQKELNSL